MDFLAASATFVGVFFRAKPINGSPLAQLVQSYRDDQGQPRQRVIASLGDARLPGGEDRGIAQAVERRLQGELDLFETELSKKAATWSSPFARFEIKTAEEIAAILEFEDDLADD